MNRPSEDIRHSSASTSFSRRSSQMTSKQRQSSMSTEMARLMSASLDTSNQKKGELFQENNYKQFLSQKLASVWTINDQKKLIALSSLYNRMLEFHNNVHTREIPVGKVYGESANATPDFDPTTPVAQMLHFQKGRKPLSERVTIPELSNFARVTAAKRQKITSFTNHININTLNAHNLKKKQHEFSWIHLQDISALDILAQEFSIHELIIAGFHDLRAHSSITPAFSELLITFITFAMENNDCNMYKLFIYVSHDLVITFFTELLPDVSELNRDGLNGGLSQSQPSQSSSQQRAGSTDTNAKTKPTFTSTHATADLMDIQLQQNSDLATPMCIQEIFEPFMEYPELIAAKCLELGSIYLVYMVILQSIKIFDSSLEFLSYVIAYFNHIVHLNLLHSERLELMIKMHMVTSGIQLMKQYMDGSVNNCLILTSSLMDNIQDDEDDESVEEGVANAPQRHEKMDLNRIIYPHLISRDHIPYLFDVFDNFQFVNACLAREFEEITRLKEVLNNSFSLRTTNTSMTLSLVATIFLPLTFLASVFGMNFQVDGGYSIELLNKNFGPTIFYLLCVGSFLMTVLFFIYQGWLEFGIFGKLSVWINDLVTPKPVKKIDDTKVVTRKRFSVVAIQRAKEEDERRKVEAELRRSAMQRVGRRGSGDRESLSRMMNAASFKQNISMPSQGIRSGQINATMTRSLPTSTVMPVSISSVRPHEGCESDSEGATTVSNKPFSHSL